MIAEVWVHIACSRGKRPALMTSSARRRVFVQACHSRLMYQRPHDSAACQLKAKCLHARTFKQLILQALKTAGVACRSLAMWKQNGPCISWNHARPLLRSTCTTPSCKWGTLFHRIFSTFFFALLLSCCFSSSVLSYWLLVGVDRTHHFAVALQHIHHRCHCSN